MTFQVALSFEDGVTRFIKVKPNETVADASYKARINIPLDCRDGACGTCKAFCESGTYDGGDYIEDALTDEEAEQGYCLPCQMMPESDLVVQIASTSDVAKTAAASYTATITELNRFSESVVGFTVEIDNRDDLVFLPGQYVNIGVPGSDDGTGKQATRSYSFSTGPHDNSLAFLVKITEGGLMSEYLRDRAQVGDTLEFTGPFGSFFLRERKRPSLLLAGGTGLAPLLSILSKIQSEGTDHPVHLIYGVTFDHDLVELEKLRAYAESLPNFTFDYCVADKDSSAPNKGYVTGLFEPQHLNDGDVDIYLCGPPPMVEAVRNHLSENSITPVNFYFEKFNTSATPGGATTPAPTDAEKAAARRPPPRPAVPLRSRHPPTPETTRSVRSTRPSPSPTSSSTPAWRSNSVSSSSPSAGSPPSSSWSSGFSPRHPARPSKVITSPTPPRSQTPPRRSTSTCSAAAPIRCCSKPTTASR